MTFDRPQPTSRSKVNIVIVEDHVLFAESLDLALTVQGYAVRRMEVPDSSATAGALSASLVRARPHIVLLDLDLGSFGDGTRLITPLARAGVHVVVITASPDRARWGQALRCGARAVLSKSQPFNDILSTVRRVLDGKPVISREEREELVRLWHERTSEHEHVEARLALLTARESQVLGHLMLGHTVHDIAASSVVSEATVRTQVKSILNKLQVSSQLAAVGLAHRAGWHPPPL